MRIRKVILFVAAFCLLASTLTGGGSGCSSGGGGGEIQATGAPAGDMAGDLERGLLEAGKILGGTVLSETARRNSFSAALFIPYVPSADMDCDGGGTFHIVLTSKSAAFSTYHFGGVLTLNDCGESRLTGDLVFEMILGPVPPSCVSNEDCGLDIPISIVFGGTSTDLRVGLQVGMITAIIDSALVQGDIGHAELMNLLAYIDDIECSMGDDGHADCEEAVPPPPTPGKPDSDGDGRPDAEDNCPNKKNLSQNDLDGDGAGNQCDTCLIVSDPDQANRDGDMFGDACDGCPDNPEQHEASTCAEVIEMPVVCEGPVSDCGAVCRTCGPGQACVSDPNTGSCFCDVAIPPPTLQLNTVIAEVPLVACGDCVLDAEAGEECEPNADPSLGNGGTCMDPARPLCQDCRCVEDVPLCEIGSCDAEGSCGKFGGTVCDPEGSGCCVLPPLQDFCDPSWCPDNPELGCLQVPNGAEVCADPACPWVPEAPFGINCTGPEAGQAACNSLTEFIGPTTCTNQPPTELGVLSCCVVAPR